ncbi:hypothetical protein QJQ45_023541 [Haematococcus lacustris]|nr:hypothetical protein QJQ45_023541 [Haematococcus lacustris]
MREHLAKVAPIDQRLKRVEVVVDNVNDQMAQHNKGKPKAPKVPGGPRIDGRVLVSGLSQYYVPFITIQVFSPHGEQIWQQAHIYSESHFNVGAPGPGTYKVCFVNPWESRTEAIVDLVYITLAHLRSRGGPVLVPKGTQASRDTEVAGVAHMEDVQRTILGLTEFMQASDFRQPEIPSTQAGSPSGYHGEQQTADVVVHGARGGGAAVCVRHPNLCHNPLLQDGQNQAQCVTQLAISQGPVPEDPDSDIEDRDEALQPDLTEAQQNRKPRVEAISERGVLASLLLGLLVRGLFTIRVADPLGLHDQPVYTDIPVSQAAIPDLSCRNLYLQLCRGPPGNGANTQPNAAVAAVLAAHPDLRARLAAIPRHLSDSNMVDHVGKQLEIAFSNMLTLLFAGRLKKSVSLAGAKVLLGTEEHRRRFGFWGVGGGHLPAWSKWACTYVRRMVCGLDVSWLVGEGGVVPTPAMQAEVALQRGLLGLEEGERVDDDWVEDPVNRGRLLRHAVHTTREMEAAMAAWQLDMVPWQQAELTNPGLLPRPPRPPTPNALTPTSKCQARHIFIDTRGLYGMMHDAGMLGVLTEAGVTSLKKFRNGALPDPAVPGNFIAGPKDSHVANRWDALLPDPRRHQLASPKHSFAQIVHTDGVAISVMFLRPKPAAPPAELPRMGRGLGAVNPLAHLHAEWLGVDPGKTNMATVAHEERSAAGTVVSVRHWKLTAGQYYRDSGITRQAQATKTWLAKVKPQLTALARVSSKPSSMASYRRFADTVLATYDAMWAEVSKKRWANAKFRLYCGKMRVVASFWAKVKKQAQKRWPDRILALAYGAASFSGSGSVGCRGVPVSQMRKEAVKQFGAGRVVLVDEFRTSRVSSAYSSPSEALPGQPPESFRWLRPVYSEAKLGPGPRPTELCYWDGRPAMPKPGRPGQEWVYLRDKALLRKWRRKWRQ